LLLLRLLLVRPVRVSSRGVILLSSRRLRLPTRGNRLRGIAAISRIVLQRRGRLRRRGIHRSGSGVDF
jgi:hypothetical protein